MDNFKLKIESFVKKYPGAYVSGSGKRSLEKQMHFVKTRPSQYKRTLNKAFNDFKLDPSKKNDKAYLAKIYVGKEDWLKRTILSFAKRGVGFQHLSGNAIDVSVRNVSLEAKKRLKLELDKAGYHIILEKVAGKQTRYNVNITQANVFHIDLLNHTK